MTLAELIADHKAKSQRADALKALPDDQLTDEILTEGTALVAELPAIKAKIDGMQAMRKSVGTVAVDANAFHKAAVRDVPHPVPGSKPPVKSEAEGTAEATESEDDKYLRRGPFKSLGHFALEVRRCGSKQSGLVKDGVLGEWNTRAAKVDLAIKAMPDAVKAASGLSELADSEGAAFTPTDVSKTVWERAMADDVNLLARVDNTPVSGNGYKLWAWNDKSKSSGILFGGAKAYWTQEAAQLTASKPSTRDIEWRLNKLAVLMFATDELMDDSMALDARLSRVAGACFAYKINDAIINGNGAGQPLGILKSGARITVAAKSGQGAGTLIAENVDKMYARRAPSAVGKMIWLYNIDAEPQFAQFNYNLGASSVAAQWLYVPAGGLTAAPNGTLKGRPLIECEFCPTVGTEGDLILWDPSSYGAIVKSSGINQGVSMHLRFDYDEMAFRWTFRMDGRPFWDDVLTPANGNTRAPIVTLNSTRT